MRQNVRDVVWVCVAHSGDQWRTLVDTTVNLRVP
jgi:hypothetical protein